MMRALLLFCFTCAAWAASDEPALAKVGVSVAVGYRAGDASLFRDIAHPALVVKIRRLMIKRLGTPQSFAPAAVVTPEDVSKLKGSELVDAFVKFVHSVNQFASHMTATWSHSLRSVVIEGSRATVVVAEHLEATNHKDGTHISTTSDRTIEFRREDDRWMYIAGPATSIHLDLPLGIFD